MHDAVGFIEIEVEAAGRRAHDVCVGEPAVLGEKVFERLLADLARLHVAIDDNQFAFGEAESPITPRPLRVHLPYLQRIVGREFEVPLKKRGEFFAALDWENKPVGVSREGLQRNAERIGRDHWGLSPGGCAAYRSLKQKAMLDKRKILVDPDMVHMVRRSDEEHTSLKREVPHAQ